MNTHIEHLNRRLGDELGRIGDGPRFAWKWAPDLYYYTRENGIVESFTRHCWAERIGKVWLLAQRRGEPTAMDPETGETVTITRAKWWNSFHGQLPYPEKDVYQAHAETALTPGYTPTAEDTALFIWTIRRQMDMSLQDHMRKINAGLEKDRLDNEKQFFDCVDDSFPAWWKNGAGHEPGTRGAHVSLPYTAQDRV